MMTRCWSHISRSWRQNYFLQFATLAVLVASYFLLTTFICVYLNCQRIVLSWGDSNQLTAYISPEISETERRQLEIQIQSMEEVDSISYISQNQAFDYFRSELGAIAPHVLNDKEFKSIFPQSFQIAIKKTLFTSDKLVSQMQELSNKITGLGGVDEIVYGQEWLKQYSVLISTVSALGLMIVIVLLGGAIFVVGNSIRLSIYSRREEIEILELVGATARMIRGPFVLEGAITGLMATALAIAGAYGFYEMVVFYLNKQFSFLALTPLMQFPPWAWVTLLLSFGVGLGTLGSYVCVCTLNDGWAARKTNEV